MNKKPTLTIGTAVHNDFDGAYFTIQSLKMNNDVSKVDLIVIDNSDNTPKGKLDSLKLIDLVEKKSGVFNSTKYLKFNTPGTTQTREQIFKEATTDFVMVMDCHVLLRPGAVNKLLKYYEENPDTKDMYTGPLIHDDATNLYTHFQMLWRSSMFGIWGNALKGSNGKYYQIEPIETLQQLKTLEFQGKEVGEVNGIDFSKPMTIQEMNSSLAKAEIKSYGTKLDDEPFEIPGQGLGLFSTSRENWLGFNEHFREFGGEEGYIHKKYLNAGRKNICLPFMQWNHRFRDPREPLTYKADTFQRVRNYVLGFKEVGLPLEGIKKEFSNKITSAEWASLLRDPENASKIDYGSNLDQPPFTAETIDEIMDWAMKRPAFINQHLATLRTFASKSDSVLEITAGRDGTIGLIAGSKKHLKSYTRQLDILTTHIMPREGEVVIIPQITEGKSNVPDKLDMKYDMLFIDDNHTRTGISDYLNKYSGDINKYILIHDTEVYGMKGVDGKEGVTYSIADFLNENPEWFIQEYFLHQHGLIVLSRVQEEKPKSRKWAWQPDFGAGSELKNMLSWLKIATENKGCSCNARANFMDRNGANWCLDNIDMIAEWLKQEYEKRKANGELSKFIPYSNMGVKMLIKKCAKKALKREKEFEKQISEGRKLSP